MPKIYCLTAILVFCGAVLAADTVSTNPAATPASAPAPIVPEPATAAVKVVPIPAIIWSGMAMLRLREELSTNSLTDGVTSNKADFSYQIAYKIGAKVKPSDQVLIQFELGNDWYGTELATGLPGNYYTKREAFFPWFSLAYAQWDPGYMHIAAGIIPVNSSAMMDLIGVSILYNKRYRNAAHTPWGAVTNFSQTGLRIGAPVLKDEFKLGVDLTSAIIESRSAQFKDDGWESNCSAVEFLLDIPMSIAGATIKPQAFVIPNRSYKASIEKSDMEIGAGLDLGYKINNQINLRAGVGYAKNSNNKSYTSGDTAFDRSGINSNIGTTVVLGKGKLDFDFNLSTEKDKKDTTVKDIYPFVDLKYGYTGLSKNFIVMPRCRVFMTYPHVKYDFKRIIRPELIFNGSF
jgi:hypothetical protein